MADQKGINFHETGDLEEQKLPIAKHNILYEILYGTLPRTIYSYIIYIVSAIVCIIVIAQLNPDKLSSDAINVTKGYFLVSLLGLSVTIFFLIDLIRDRDEGTAIELHDPVQAESKSSTPYESGLSTKYESKSSTPYEHTISKYRDPYIQQLKSRRSKHVLIWLAFLTTFGALFAGFILLVQGEDRGIIALVTLLVADTTFNLVGHIRNQIDAEKYKPSKDGEVIFKSFLLRTMLKGTTEKMIYSIGIWVVSIIVSLIMIQFLNADRLSDDQTWIIQFALRGYLCISFFCLMLAILYVSKMVRNKQEAESIETHAKGTELHNPTLIKTLKDTGLYRVTIWVAFSLAIAAIAVGIFVMVDTRQQGMVGLIALMIFDSTFNLIMNIRNWGDAKKY